MIPTGLDNEINYTSPLKLEASDAFINLLEIWAKITKKKHQMPTTFYRLSYKEMFCVSRLKRSTF